MFSINVLCYVPFFKEEKQMLFASRNKNTNMKTWNASLDKVIYNVGRFLQCKIIHDI